jgi:hypothetical protein
VTTHGLFLFFLGFGCGIDLRFPRSFLFGRQHDASVDMRLDLQGMRALFVSQFDKRPMRRSEREPEKHACRYDGAAVVVNLAFVLCIDPVEQLVEILNRIERERRMVVGLVIVPLGRDRVFSGDLALLLVVFVVLVFDPGCADGRVCW